MHGTMWDMTEKKTLLLVDGSSYLYRAFHAMPDLRAVPGDPSSAATGAIRGMVNMMQSLRKEVPADYAVCVFDAKGPTFRDEIYPAYKANRSPMPDDLRTQIEPIHHVVRLMGWQVLDVPGVEADDVIGTLAVLAAKQSIEVIVSSGDKDLSQLVDQHITIIDTMNGKRRDVAGVTAEFGVPPHLMVDFQTLVGDTVDNVPGVQKVGPKTAAKWLMEYGSLEALLKNAHAIKGVVGENLRQALDWLPTGRQLVTIKTDCDLSTHVPTLPAMDALTLNEPDRVALQSFYERYGKTIGMAASVAFIAVSITLALLASGGYLIQKHNTSITNLSKEVQELKTMQEVITLVVFAGFSTLILKEPLTLNHGIGFGLILAGAYFVFKAPLG